MATLICQVPKRNIILSALALLILLFSAKVESWRSWENTEYMDSSLGKRKALVEKYETLKRISSEEPLFQMNSRQFDKFVVETPRNYTIFLLFTDDRSKYATCTTCRVGRKSLRSIAAAYHSTNISNKPAFFFAEICSDDSPELFSRIGILFSQIPSLFRVPPKGMLTNLKEMNTNDYSFESKSIISWIQDITGFEIEIPRTIKPIKQDKSSFMYLMLSLFVLTGICLTNENSFVRKGLIFIYESLRKGSSGSVATFIISMILMFISGIMYCHIEGAAIFHRNHEGEMFFFYPSTHGQFIAEMYIVYTLYAAAVYGMIQLIELPENIKTMEKSKVDGAGSYALGCFVVPVIFLVILMKLKLGA